MLIMGWSAEIGPSLQPGSLIGVSRRPGRSSDFSSVCCGGTDFSPGLFTTFRAESFS